MEPQKSEKAEKTENSKKQLWQEYRSLLIRCGVFLLILYLVFSKILFLKQVEGIDMFPSLKDGDLVLGYRLQKDFQTDDVIAYEEEGRLRFGRVIAHGGDQVNINESGEVKVNGVSEGGEILYLTYDGGNLKYPYQVPKNTLFVLGDYRTEAKDSRSYGAIPMGQVKGKVITFLRRRGL